MEANQVTIIGEGWERQLTKDEYDAWATYDNNHPVLAGSMPMEPILDMFLSHFRRGINLNLPLV